MAKNNCVICGKEGYKYLPFCYEHLQEKNEGKIIKCENCGNWHYTKESCKCQITQKSNINTYKKIPNDLILKEKENTCKKCGQPSGKYDVCYDCFRNKTNEDLKRDLETLVQSEKDSGIDIRGKYDNARIKTNSGHYVRSHAECRIADWLYSHKISYEYERMVLSKNDIHRFLLSDFFIPEAGKNGIFIEYWGYKDSETYNKRRNEKKTIYEENNLIMTDLEDKHLYVLDDAMKMLLHPHANDELKAKLN